MANAPSPLLWYRTLDVLLCMAKELSWPTLISFGHLSKTAGEACAIEKRNRILHLVALVIPGGRDAAVSFFEALKQCDGVVTGLLVRTLLASDSGRVDEEEAPSKMHVVVSMGCDPIHRTLTKAGFTLISTFPDRFQKDVVESVERYQVVRSSGKVVQVLVSISKRAPVSVVLKSYSTADMCMITHKEIIAFYPRLAFVDEGLFMFGLDNETRDDSGFRVETSESVYTSNLCWTRRCGWYCPAIRRKTIGDAGVARYDWTFRVPDKDAIDVDQDSTGEWGWGNWSKGRKKDVVEAERIEWRVLPRCRNVLCVHMQTYGQRAAVLGE